MPNAVQRIARNSALPIAAQLVNKVVDFGFVVAVARLLGPEGRGQYVIAVQVWLLTKTITDFGLATLTTREVARDPALAGTHLGLTTILRLLLWAVAAPFVGLAAFAGWRWSDLSAATAVAIALLILSIVPDSYSDAANAICNAFERMGGPALLTVVKNVLKVLIGLAALAAGWGPIGLAATALATNLLTAGFFRALLRRLEVAPVWLWPGPKGWRLLAEAWPLLLNSLLVGLFFRVDLFVLRHVRDDTEVGRYDLPYGFLNVLLLVPQYFTLALFPHLSRLAAGRAQDLAATYGLAIKLLLILALPICVATAFVAPDLMLILGGPDYLPDSGTALRLLIWFLPFSYVNGLVQYVLIAAGRQQLLTRAFALVVTFNVGANLLFTPRFGFVAAAVITVLSEVVLLVPFLWLLRRHVGLLPPLAVVLRPLVAATVMGGVAWPIYAGLVGRTTFAAWVAIAAGGLAYLLALVVTRGIGPVEQRLALRLLGKAA